jgi:hypothetical protein
MKNPTCLALSLFALGACSHEVELSYLCVPSGAAIVEEGIGYVGTCPVNLEYNSRDVAVNDGAIHTRSVSVQWASGASLLMPPQTLELSSDNKATVVFTRPENFPYDKKDMAFSVAYEKGVPTTETKFVVSPNQDRDVFDALNKSVTCAFGDLTRAVYTRCP